MAENSDISALYPPPPPFYKLFTPENVQKYNQLRKNGESADSLGNIPDIKFLVPPKQPEKEQYRSFGDLWWFEDKQVGLKESGIVQIYGDAPLPDKTPVSTSEDVQMSDASGKIEPKEEDDEETFSISRINELKKMTKSLLLNFLELVGLLSKNPSLAATKVEHIRTILINIHHLLNSYRLHQSRETLILTMQKKLSETEDEIHSIKETCENVEEKMKLLVSRLQKLQSSKPNSESAMLNSKLDLSLKSKTDEKIAVSVELRQEAMSALSSQLQSSK